jgi:prophage regulatory protein
MTDQDEFVSRAYLAERLDVGVRTLVRWASQGYGPPPVKLGPRAVRYRRQDVDAFLAERVREAS